MERDGICPICAHTRPLIVHPSLTICTECRKHRQLGLLALIVYDEEVSDSDYIKRTGDIHWVSPILVSMLFNTKTLQQITLAPYMYIPRNMHIEIILDQINEHKVTIQEIARRNTCPVCKRTSLDTCDRYIHPFCIKRIDN